MGVNKSSTGARSGPERIAVDFGRLLRHYRRRRRLTQVELSGLAAVSVRAIRNLERGQVGVPRRDTVRLLSDALRLTARERVELDRATGVEAGGTTLETRSLTAPAMSRPLRGRDQEVATLLKHTLGRHRHVTTVSGFSGVGKTHLAVAVAREVEARGALPVLWVPVRTDSDDSVLDGLAASIGDGAALVVLDGNDADRVSRAGMRSLVRACPELRILETSRTPRDSSSDYHLTLRPLSVAEPIGSAGVLAVPAVALLLDLVADLRPGFVADGATLDAYAEVCRRLDGLPRALESAASWFTIISTEEVVRMARTDPHLLATSPGGDADAATTVREAILAQPPASRDLLTRLSDWPCPWTVHDVASRTGIPLVDVARTVHFLLGHGLIVQVTGDDDLVRFTVLNIVRACLRRAAEAVASRPNLRRSPAWPAARSCPSTPIPTARCRCESRTQ